MRDKYDEEAEHEDFVDYYDDDDEVDTTPREAWMGSIAAILVMLVCLAFWAGGVWYFWDKLPQ